MVPHTRKFPACSMPLPPITRAALLGHMASTDLGAASLVFGLHAARFVGDAEMLFDATEPIVMVLQLVVRIHGLFPFALRGLAVFVPGCAVFHRFGRFGFHRLTMNVARHGQFAGLAGVDSPGHAIRPVLHALPWCSFFARWRASKYPTASRCLMSGNCFRSRLLLTKRPIKLESGSPFSRKGIILAQKKSSRVMAQTSVWQAVFSMKRAQMRP